MSPLYESLRTVSEKLKHTADAEAQQSIADELANIEKLWLNTDSQLAEQLQQLESTSRVWDEVEAAMEMVLEQLKKTQRLLIQPLSDKYDELERELQHCQVCNLLTDIFQGSVAAHLRSGGIIDDDFITSTAESAGERILKMD